MNIALLAGTHSGCGKTTVMLALLQYLIKQGLKPRGFKVGPDFLDPLWHAAVTGLPSYNLDTQMVGIAESRRLLNRLAKNAQYGLLEGVMGMFDGRSGVGLAGSSVDLASQLEVPTMLVVDAQGMSGSIVPLVSGYCDFARQRNSRITGIIANRVGSEFHARLLAEALADYRLPPLIAWLNKDAPKLEERQLGLKIPEKSLIPDFEPALHVDHGAFLAAFSPYVPGGPEQPATACLQDKTVAIAKDVACCFIYPANVDWLLEQGAKLAWFSPLAGEPVPAADALWLPGGYPELHAEQLAQSASLVSIKAFIESGKPVLAECGGTMLLGETLIDNQGKPWPMASVLPFESRMQSKLAALGYREDDSGMRGHEFHYSTRASKQTFEPGFSSNGDRGIRFNNLRASYNHWYFPSAPKAITEWLT
ncbi:cobyrinate a,c-diamide synthase [Methylomonas methanica]|uniref:CobB/CobQ domain protein glutamine amidotransferase n=1 Tax=Methylomonas methanica (strain DSM 25384 / MC09) TaxID=857087 RepID=G0A2P8_METMM|nr:cobyrinate a,c-diamide synthase [Methylomonas methanica]AEG01401.1 CobB/CobQ domain protein glutamine amidotransferase [Methylomonas methanica MC09]